MKAIVVDKPGDPHVLKIQEKPIPSAKPGWVLIKVKAFGLNRSESMPGATTLAMMKEPS